VSVVRTRPSASGGRPPRGAGTTRAWRWTASTGAALLVLVTVHMVAHHFVVEDVGGLRSYRQVLEYVSHPAILTIEAFFLLVVTIHGLLGLRSVLFDLNLAIRARRRVDVGLWILGLATVAYGFFLLGTLASRA
jgi:succinate dehydrogenase hydrophobic anchor subunit